MTIESDIATYLRDRLAGPPCSILTDEVRAGPIQPVTPDQTISGAVPERCIFIVPTGGFTDTPYIDGGAGTSEQRPTAQILVRSPPRDYDAGRVVAEEVYNAMNLTAFAGYFDSRAVSGGPAYLQEDEQNHHQWVINVMLKRSTA